MSHNPNKLHTEGFKLSSGFNQLYSSKKQQTQQFIKELSNQKRQSISKQKLKTSKKTNLEGNKLGSLFKLNTHSDSLLNDIPVETIKKKSQSRLQSMNDYQEGRGRFSLLESQSIKKQNIHKERKQLLKKYNIDINSVLSQQTGSIKPQIAQIQNVIQQQEPQGTVRPSQLYTINNKISDPILMPTIFQTPLLPCFPSQFSMNPQFSSSKTIRQGQGVWRIGKIKIKKNKAVLKIGQIQYDSQFVNGEGKCIGIKQDFLYKLKNWNGVWVCQPKDETFLS